MKYMYTIYLQIPVQKFTGEKSKSRSVKKLGSTVPRKEAFSLPNQLTPGLKFGQREK